MSPSSPFQAFFGPREKKEEMPLFILFDFYQQTLSEKIWEPRKRL
jgi:hypothetical protein